MDKNTNVQSNKNTNVTIQSELALYQRTGNSTHARTIADRLALALELGNIDAGFLLGLDTRLQLVPSTGGNVSAPLGDALVKDDYRGDYVGHGDGHHMSW